MRAGPPHAGVDRALAEPGRWLAGDRLGLLTNAASTTDDGRPTLDALREALGGRLRVLFTFEHGLSGFEEDARPVPDRVDERTGLRLHSLYGPRRRPDPDVLAELDAVVVDVQEVGVRPYTYAATVALLLEAAAEAGTRVVVCDRPNLLGPRLAGPPLDPVHRSFLAYLDVPYGHGLTLGELARLHAATLSAGEAPTVVPLSGWRRGDPPSGPFVPPSPGLPSRDAVALYPGLVLLEGVNASEGRGTPLPFALVGAPWLEGHGLAREANAMPLPGLWARPLAFVPEAGRFRGRTCGGVQLHVTDAAALRPLEAGLRLLRHLRERHEAFAWLDAASMPWSDAADAGRPWHEPTAGLLIDGLAGSGDVRAVVEGRLGVDEALASWRAAHEGFLAEAAPHLLYDPAPVPGDAPATGGGDRGRVVAREA